MIVGIDFDGTVVKHAYPLVGEEVDKAVMVMKKLVSHGHQLILYTMRSDESLLDAEKWFEDRSIPLYGVNNNPSQRRWTNSIKVYAHVYIDDAALGCPLLEGGKMERPFVDWDSVDKLLEQRGLYSAEQ